MNQFDQNNDMETLLQETAEKINPNPMFVVKLEEQLKDAHKPRKSFALPSFRSFAPAMAWTVVLISLAFVMNWALGAFRPQIGASGTPGFVCPVTKPNGSIPPGETVESPDYLGNDALWTALWHKGKIFMLPENQNADGSFSMKWTWWRGVNGALTIEGHRLDAEAEALSADIPEGYGDTGFQVAEIIFPTTGCWEVTGRVGDSSLTFVTEVIFGESTPTPVAIIDDSATPVADDGGYPFRGAKLYLENPLPELPAEANVYSLKRRQPMTFDEIRALAERFGIQGEMYENPGPYAPYANTPTYIVTDGKQQLEIMSGRYLTYTSDIVKYMRPYVSPSNENAEAIVMDFLKAHGFDSPFDMTNSELYGAYTLRQISPDGLPMQYEFYSPPAMQVQLDENGNVLTLRASPIEYDPNPLGTYGIITAEEALQKLLDDYSAGGKIESVHSNGIVPPQMWYREYPDNQTIALRGSISIRRAVDSSKPPLILMDSATMLIGNTSGMEELQDFSFVQTTGQYIVENGIRKFEVQSWEAKGQQDYVVGSLRSDGDQIIIVSDNGQDEYPLIDPPTDVPLNTKFPESQLAVSGTVMDGKMDWTFIQYFADASQMGGGGGGGGMGFYQLNLSGTPIPIPTPTLVPAPITDPNAQQYVVKEGDDLELIAEIYNISVEALMQANGLTNREIYIGQTLVIPAAIAPTRLDGESGMLAVTIFTKNDGSQRVEYGFISDSPITAEISYMSLQGENLESLQQYNNKPVKIWGVTDKVNNLGALVVNVEKFEIPYPDLKSQILKGIEKSVDLEGKKAVLFTAEDGATYVEFTSGCNDLIPMESMAGMKNGNADAGDKSIQVEALIVPDLSFAGYPGICIFQIAPATQANGEPLELTINSNEPYVTTESPYTTGDYVPPNLTIDNVELIYFTSNPDFGANPDNAVELYIQPAWHLHGHYENGDEFDAVIQALKPEFLSPDLAPYIQGG